MENIYFDGDFGKRDFRLFEINSDIEAIILANEDSNSNKLSIIGEDQTVLISSKKTWAIKKVETSNHVFITQDKLKVIGDCHSYYELAPIIPKINETILKLLQNTAYISVEEELNNPPPKALLLTESVLQSKIMASDTEFQTLLNSAGIIELQGYMRLISSSACLEIIEVIFDTIIENGWDINFINESKLCAALSNIDYFLLQHVLHYIGKPIFGVVKAWELSEIKVSQYSARILFQDAHKRVWNLVDFLTMWQARTPGAMKYPKSEYLEGVALITHNNSLVKYADVETMSPDIKSRLKMLFELDTQLTLEQLLPYLHGFYGSTGQPTSPTELLLEYCRVTDGGKFTLSKEIIMVKSY